MSTNDAKTQHTPGPWDNEPDCPRYSNGEHHQLVTAMDGERIIARVVGKTLGEAQANARLIAAAPELLAIVKYMLGYVQSDIDDLKTKGMDPADQTLHVFEQARAAIAKAEGRA